MTKIKVEKIHNETEKKILILLQENGECSMGEILRKLKLGHKSGFSCFSQLMKKRWISHTDNPPYYTLNVELS
ncbi:MAG: winged helix-turn-helix domain-containing protein [Mangrovibacterium sp.]